MKLEGPMLVVSDMDSAVAFYKTVLGLQVTADFGANKTLTGGLSLQTLDTYRDFIGGKPVAFGGNDFELYFEEDDFDSFLARLKGMEIRYVHPVLEHPWGQRVVRFYDPDGHIVEVGENIRFVCRRFMASGLTPEETAKRMDVPVEFVKASVECV